MGTVIRLNFTTLILSFFILFFLTGYSVIQFGILSSSEKELAAGDIVIENLKKEQVGQSEILDQIKSYRNGLFVLKLILDARKNVINGSDEKNPFLVFDYNKVLEDLRLLLPRDTRVAQFQVNNKGLVTAPIESVDYASLGRVIKSLKDSELFTEVKIPSGVQRALVQTTNSYGVTLPNYVYSFVLQATLNPKFWQNPMPFVDVNPRMHYSQAIRDLFISKAIEGYEKNEFKPDQDINRAEFFKIALFELLSNNEISINEYQQYKDLSEEDWYFKYVQLASKMGVAEGDNVGRFHPGQTVSRIEAIKSILTIFKIEILDPAKEQVDAEGNKKPLIMPFMDITSDDKDYPFVLTAVRSGFWKDIKNLETRLNKTKPATRAEVAFWVWKLKFDYLNK